MQKVIDIPDEIHDQSDAMKEPIHYKHYKIPLYWDPVAEKLGSISASKVILQDKIDSIPDSPGLPLFIPLNMSNHTVPIENIFGMVTKIDLENANISVDVISSRVPLLQMLLDKGWLAAFQMLGNIIADYEDDVLVQRLTCIARIIGLELILPRKEEISKEVQP